MKNNNLYIATDVALDVNKYAVAAVIIGSQPNKIIAYIGKHKYRNFKGIRGMIYKFIVLYKFFLAVIADIQNNLINDPYKIELYTEIIYFSKNLRTFWTLKFAKWLFILLLQEHFPNSFLNGKLIVHKGLKIPEVVVGVSNQHIRDAIIFLYNGMNKPLPKIIEEKIIDLGEYWE